ncbi:MAG: hypothetical protein JSR77_09370 [Planctomycetes bacterium]|nr:hypothetical protein [Planctomycetota bacterium]
MVEPITQPLGSFNPPDNRVDQILADYFDPHCSLHAIAERHQTSIPALADWLAQPQIRQRLDAISNTATHRARVLASNNLDKVVSVALHILAKFGPGAAAAGNPAANAHLVRAAAAMLLRLSRIPDCSKPSRPAAAPQSQAQPRTPTKATPSINLAELVRGFAAKKAAPPNTPQPASVPECESSPEHQTQPEPQPETRPLVPPARRRSPSRPERRSHLVHAAAPRRMIAPRLPALNRRGVSAHSRSPPRFREPEQSSRPRSLPSPAQHPA